MLKESGLKPVHILLLCLSFRSFGKYGAYDLLQQPYGRRKYDHYRQSVHGIYKGYGHHVHRLRHKRKIYDRIQYVKYASADDSSENVYDQIDESCSLTVGPCPKCAEHYRNRRADTDTHDDGESHVELHSSGHSQSLQDTYGSAGALNDSSQDQAGKNAQYGVAEAGEKADETFIFPERRY